MELNGVRPADGLRLERTARRRGVADRVRVRTLGPRDALLPEIARAGVLVHPSFHDDAPPCFGEALSLGTPAVCLDHGGPSDSWFADAVLDADERAARRTHRGQ